ncbi:MAG TPA: DUF5625 family protein [Arsenophonus apicola]
MWRTIMLLFSSVWLVACTEHIRIYRPIDITRAGQSVKVEFEIKKQGDYQFALLFETGEGHDEMERRFELFGANDKAGVVIPVSLRIVKDGQVFFDEEINTKGTGWGRAFYYEGRRINTAAVREIKLLPLSPGRYSVVITTLEDVALFNGIESFVHVTYFDPKI